MIIDFDFYFCVFIFFFLYTFLYDDGLDNGRLTAGACCYVVKHDVIFYHKKLLATTQSCRFRRVVFPAIEREYRIWQTINKMLLLAVGCQRNANTSYDLVTNVVVFGFSVKKADNGIIPYGPEGNGLFEMKLIWRWSSAMTCHSTKIRVTRVVKTWTHRSPVRFNLLPSMKKSTQIKPRNWIVLMEL